MPRTELSFPERFGPRHYRENVRCKLLLKEIESERVSYSSYERTNLVICSRRTGELECEAYFFGRAYRRGTVRRSFFWNDIIIHNFVYLDISESRSRQISKARIYPDIFASKGLVRDSISVEFEDYLLREARHVGEEEERP